MNESTIDLLRKLIRKTKGSKKSGLLLHAFENGFSDGWFFEIDKVFRAALGITLEENGEYSQGSTFAFKEGDMLYSSPKGYIVGLIADIGIQVKESRSASQEDVDKKLKTKKCRDPGSVTFDLYTYKPEFTHRLSKMTTQDEFVEFLIAGPRKPGWEDVAEVAREVGMSW